MKNKNHLNLLIKRLVKEAVAKKLGEGQPIGGIKNDHEFDAGRHNVMKAVNIGENDDDRKCDCGSGQHSEWEYDGNGIPLVRACPKCKQQKLRRYRPEILRPYSQADVDEPIEPDDYEESVQEKIGFDGKYVNDMESGVAVKKLHGLDEEDESPEDIERGKHYIKGKFVDRGEVQLQGGMTYEQASKIANHLWDIFGSLGKDAKGVYNFKTRGDRFCCSVGMLNGKPAVLNITTTPGRLQLLVGDEIGLSGVSEETGTGAVGGYSTPFAFKKKKKKSNESVLGFAAGAAAGATATLAYRFIKDLIKHLLTNKSLDINSPLTEKKIDIFMKLAKQQNPKLKDEDIELVRNAFNTALKNGSIKTVGDMMTFGKDVFSEETGTGSVAGYSTPFAFSKKKDGSSRAIAAAKKYGTVVKSIS